MSDDQSANEREGRGDERGRRPRPPFEGRFAGPPRGRGDGNRGRFSPQGSAPKPRRRRGNDAPVDHTRSEFAPVGPSIVSLAGTSMSLAIEPSQAIYSAEVDASGRHPHIYSRQVVKVDSKAKAGDWLVIYRNDGKQIGYGLYNPKSQLTIRLLAKGTRLPDVAWWEQRLQSAVDFRTKQLRLDENADCYRVIHAEADGISGLMVDRYGPVLSAEVFSLAIYPRVHAILDRLEAMLGTKHRVIRTAPQALSQESLVENDFSSEGCPRETVVQEFGTRFRVKFEGGHKTGFFCDQRDNRKLLAEQVRDKTVLDICCYTGGFAVQAKRIGQAREVTAIDLDEGPIAIAKQNANLNQVRINVAQADAFTYLRELHRSGRTFDVVVLDPPKWIRSRAELEEGIKRHFDLNCLAMKVVAPTGLLLTCTCSGLLVEDEFMRMLAAATTRVSLERPIRTRLRAMTGAASCHPVAFDCQETKYLKAAWVDISPN